MKVEGYACDECGMRIDDIYAGKGWLLIDGQVSLSRGRDWKRLPVVQTGFLDNGLRHFCSIDCFVAKLKNIPDNDQAWCYVYPCMEKRTRFEPGWLGRQFEKAESDVKQWPEWKRRLGESKEDLPEGAVEMEEWNKRAWGTSAKTNADDAFLREIERRAGASREEMLNELDHWRTAETTSKEMARVLMARLRRILGN